MHTAIIPTAGIGDCLLMLIVANNLFHKGEKITLFHDRALSLQTALPYLNMLPKSQFQEKDFHRIIVENDNSSFINSLINNHSIHPKLHIFYPSYKIHKHAPISPRDFIFHPKKNFADNIAFGCQKLFSSPYSKEIGLQLPSSLEKGKNKKRIVIHPTSADPRKNWPLKKFISLGLKLQKRGYEVAFSLSCEERAELSFLEKMGFLLPLFHTLVDLSSYLFQSQYFIGNDSGPAHLASYLHIPSTIFFSSSKTRVLWQPGWKKANILTPPSFLPNIKGVRIKDRYGLRFITVSTVLKLFS